MNTKLDKHKDLAIKKVENMDAEEFMSIQIFISGMEAMKQIKEKQMS